MQQTLALKSAPSLIFLGMSSKTASAVIAARPELKALKEAIGDASPKCRKLGEKGDPSIRTLVNAEADGAIIVGFSIPSNITARASRAIEIPIGNAFPRAKLSEAIGENEYVTLATALAQMARIPLKAYITSTVPITHGLDMKDDMIEEEEEEEVNF